MFVKDIGTPGSFGYPRPAQAWTSALMGKWEGSIRRVLFSSAAKFLKCFFQHLSNILSTIWASFSPDQKPAIAIEADTQNQIYQDNQDCYNRSLTDQPRPKLSDLNTLLYMFEQECSSHVSDASLCPNYCLCLPSLVPLVPQVQKTNTYEYQNILSCVSSSAIDVQRRSFIPFDGVTKFH